MNKKIVERLWLVANKVRGAFEISELCKVMIYTLFLKYIEIKRKQDESDDILSVYDDKFSLGYLSLTYGRMVDAFNLANYVAEVERALNLESNIIADEFRRLLEKADVDLVKVIFEAVDQIDFESNEQLYDIALMLLNKLAYASGRMSGEAFTNLSLCKLETRLLDCKEDMLVYDGFCGCGVSINEVADNKGIVYLQDMNVSTLALATVITLLKGNKIGGIRCGDSQLNPLSDAKYDRIVSEPPFLPKYSNDYFIAMPQGNCVYQGSLDGESLALRHCLAHLKEDGIAVVLVPMSFLFKSGRGAEIREKLVVDKFIDTVIELPPGILPNTGAATALIVFKNNRPDDSIYLINAKEFFEKIDRNQIVISDENIARIVELYQSRESVEGVSHNTSIEEIAANGFNLCTTQYVTLSPEDTITIEDTTVYVQKYDQLVGQLAEIDKQLGAVRGRFTKEV